MASNNIAFALGLAQKAGKVASGDFDAAPNSKKDMYYLAEVAGVEVVELLTRDELGFAIGKAKRTALAITDLNFAKMIKK